MTSTDRGTGRRRSPAGRLGPRPTRSSVVRHAVTRFIGWSVAVLVVVAASTLLLSRPLAESLALREAKERSIAFARSVVAPLVDDDVLGGDGPASTPLVRIMEARMADGSIAHMKIWNEDGRVLWSEEPGVTGQTYELEPDVAALFTGTGATAEVSDLDKPENAQEQFHEQLIEVYVGFRGAGGQPLVFEAYWPTERIQHDVGDLRWQFTGLGLGALLLLAVALLPLAVSLARRVDRGLAEREEMTAQALSASDLERRRLSQDLHDGLVQDIAGVAYVLPAVSAALPESATAERELLDRAAADLARSAAGARELLTDVYPADLESGGLLAAVDGLADRQRRQGIDVRVSVDPRLDETLPVAQLVYRIVREGLRNVAKHAAASAVEVRALRRGDRVVVEVRDDGVGLSRPAAQPQGDGRLRNLGLQLLRDTLRTLGGELSTTGGPDGRGVVLHAEFPVVMGSSAGGARAGASRPPEP